MTNDKTQKQIEMKDLYDVLSSIQITLNESLKWTKFAGIKEVKPVLESNLKGDTKKMIYSLSDGVNSSYEIARRIGANDTVRRDISDYWDEWEKAGLGDSKPAQGKGNRFKRSFNLEDFGIKVPEIPKNVKTEQPQSVIESQPSEEPKTEVKSDAD
jgi:hypothetical protein